MSHWQWYEVGQSQSSQSQCLKAAQSISAEKRIHSVPHFSPAVPWRSLGRVKGLTAPPLSTFCSWLSVVLVWYSKRPPWCRNTDTPSSPTAKVRPFSPPPTLPLLSQPCNSVLGHPLSSFVPLWLGVWYWAAGASGCTNSSCRICTNPQQYPAQAEGISH